MLDKSEILKMKMLQCTGLYNDCVYSVNKSHYLS